MNNASKRWIKTFVSGAVAAAIIFAVYVYLNSDEIFCNGEHANVRCYVESPFPRIAAGDFDSVIPRAFDTIRSEGCNDLALAKDATFAATSLIPLNVHVLEETIEFLDHLAAEDPECLLKAVEDLSDDRLNKIRIGLHFVKESDHYHSGGTMKLKPFSQELRYKRLIDFLMRPVTEEELRGS